MARARLGAAIPLLRLAVTVVTQRRVDRLSLFSLSPIGSGTAIGLVTADPRLLLARESYLTAAWGAAFLLDAAARVVMAHTLPVDVVSLASTALLAVLLVIVLQASKAYGRRHLQLREPAASQTKGVTVNSEGR